MTRVSGTSLSKRVIGALDVFLPPSILARADVEEVVRARAFMASALFATMVLLPISLRDLLVQGDDVRIVVLQVLLQASLWVGVAWRFTGLPLAWQAGLLLLEGVVVIFGFSFSMPFTLSTSVFWIGGILAGAAFFVGVRFAFALWALAAGLAAVHAFRIHPFQGLVDARWPFLHVDRYVDMVGAWLLILFTLLAYRSLHRHLANESADRLARFLEQQAALQTSAKFVALGEFAGVLAHQLNNPLAVIVGRTSQLRMVLPRNEKEEIAHCLDRIETTALHMARMIEALRRFSRSGENDPLEVASLADILARMKAIVEDRLHAEGIALSIACPESLHVRCRPALLEQVFLNLLANARQGLSGTPSHEKQVRIEALGTRSRKGECVELRVEDNGCGIDETAAERIFQPFFTTKPPDEGTGLGLSLSLGIVRDLGGDLVLDNRRNPTRFVLTLPAAHPQSTS